MASKKTSAKTSRANGKAAKKGGSNGARKASAKASKPTARMDRRIRPGFISHTELASSDPAATRSWAEKTFGWAFSEMPSPTGPYHMWSFGEDQGGGIRANNPPEMPGTVPYVEVADIKRAFQKALGNGATEMLAPQEIPGSGGWIAIVQAPGGPAIGFWGTK